MNVAEKIGGTRMPRLARLCGLALAVAVVLGCLSQAAMATISWEVVSASNSTVRAGEQLTYFVDVINRGDEFSDGSAYTVTATLPAGFRGVSGGDANPFSGFGFNCGSPAGATVISCSTSTFALPDVVEEVAITVDVDPGATGINTASFEVSGGGASSSATTVDPVRISDEPPTFGIAAFDGQVTGDASGTPFTQAGGHPYGLSTAIEFNTATDPSPTASPFEFPTATIGPNQPVEPVKNIVVDLPPGLVGNPTSASQCTNSALANTVGVNPVPLCPPTSQVGTALVVQNGQKLGNVIGPIPVFNLVPPANVPARFGLNVAGTVVVLDASIRTGSDYGVTVIARNTSAAIAVTATRLEFWGVPSDPSHDSLRACAGQTGPGSPGGVSCDSGAPRKAFFRNPTACTAPLTGLMTTVRADSWMHPGDFKTASFESHLPPGYPFAPEGEVPWGPKQGPDGCTIVPFDPVLDGKPLTGTKAAGPAPFTFDLTLPQSDDPDAVGESDLKKAVVTLPEGVHVTPAGAGGLQACDSAQIALRSDSFPTCPDGSKVGSVTIDTPLLDEQVNGSIYLAKPFDNPFNSLLAIYLVARAHGVVLKLPGEVRTDPITGQITTTLDNQPQLPFSRVHLEFKTGPRTPLALPNRCGLYTTHAELTGWNGSTVISDSSFTMSENAKGQPCPPKFTPGFDAGTTSNSAGSPSSFLLRFTRDDDDQQLHALTVNVPSGLTAKIKNADLCSERDAQAGTCGEGSKIGNVTVGAGAGSDPFFITNGRAYLTGPYKGAPYGASIVVPAVAGPFDLGNVIVRSALFVDKHDATVRIVSDSLPTILQGIPLDVRDVRVSIDKPDFFINPTSCTEKTIRAVLQSTEGATASVSSRFQAADCGSLKFKPRMVLRVGGRGHTTRNRTTPFSTTLTMPARDQTNLRFVRVTLPKTINARLTVINDACTRAQFEADIRACAHAQAGTAKAVTPLLRDPLSGGVYFVKNGHPLPDLFVALRGQVAFDLIGRITIPGSTRLATTFATAPDVPVRSFSLKLFGDPRNGSVGAAANLCSARSRRAKAEIDYIAQNGKVRQVAQALKVSGCSRHRAARHRRHARRGRH